MTEIMSDPWVSQHFFDELKGLADGIPPSSLLPPSFSFLFFCLLLSKHMFSLQRRAWVRTSIKSSSGSIRCQDSLKGSAPCSVPSEALSIPMAPPSSCNSAPSVRPPPFLPSLLLHHLLHLPHHHHHHPLLLSHHHHHHALPHSFILSCWCRL